jgi:Tol biopolymer transport system component
MNESASAIVRIVVLASIAGPVLGQAMARRSSAGPGFTRGATTRVSIGPAEAQGNSASWWPSISGNGRYVAFESFASNLVPQDTNGFQDVFVRDCLTGITERVSVDSTGLEGNSLSESSSISADGRYVAFESDASNLVALDTNGVDDIFVHDRATGDSERVSVDSLGNQAVGQGSTDASISSDGRYVAFRSGASNLVALDTNGVADIFVHDRQTGITERMSVDSGGAQGNASCTSPSISGDGRYVAFDSLASNLVPFDTNGVRDVFVHDRQTGTTERVSVDSAGVQGTAGSFVPSISSDGRYVAFFSFAIDLVPSDTNATSDVFVHDRQTGTTERVSRSSAGSQANGYSAEPSISSDGRYVAFESDASNLVPSDTNSVDDVFVHSLLR